MGIKRVPKKSKNTTRTTRRGTVTKTKEKSYGGMVTKTKTKNGKTKTVTRKGLRRTRS